jgi:hypothetical protein
VALAEHDTLAVEAKFTVAEVVVKGLTEMIATGVLLAPVPV